MDFWFFPGIHPFRLFFGGIWRAILLRMCFYPVDKELRKI